LICQTWISNVGLRSNAQHVICQTQNVSWFRLTSTRIHLPLSVFPTHTPPLPHPRACIRCCRSTILDPCSPLPIPDSADPLQQDLLPPSPDKPAMSMLHAPRHGSSPAPHSLSPTMPSAWPPTHSRSRGGLPHHRRRWAPERRRVWHADAQVRPRL
jgi:hypothetical protein